MVIFDRCKNTSLLLTGYMVTHEKYILRKM